MPGPFILDISRLDWGDVPVSDADPETLNKVGDILGTTRRPPQVLTIAGSVVRLTTTTSELLSWRAPTLSSRPTRTTSSEGVKDSGRVRVDVIDPQEAVSRITS